MFLFSFSFFFFFLGGGGCKGNHENIVIVMAVETLKLEHHSVDEGLASMIQCNICCCQASHLTYQRRKPIVDKGSMIETSEGRT